MHGAGGGVQHAAFMAANPRLSSPGLTPQHPPPSSPGLTPQVGFTRLAALRSAALGQARVPLRSICFAKSLLPRMMDARVKPAHDDLGCRARIFSDYNAKIMLDYVTDL
jgi:hypothetical protein